MKSFAYKTLYTRDQSIFEARVIGIFIFSLLFTSNILLQFNSASKIVGIIIVAVLPFILLMAGLYYYYKPDGSNLRATPNHLIIFSTPVSGCLIYIKYAPLAIGTPA